MKQFALINMNNVRGDDGRRLEEKLGASFDEALFFIGDVADHREALDRIELGKAVNFDRKSNGSGPNWRSHHIVAVRRTS